MRFLVALLFSCSLSTGFAQVLSKENDPKAHPRLTNKTFVDKIAGKPIEYYLSHKSVGAMAKLFYKGEFAVSDDATTFGIMDSVLTRSKDTQAFYFFLLNQIIKVSDGALSEYVSVVSAEYLREFPCEFFGMIDDKTYGVDLKQWSGLVAFTLFGPGAVKSYLDGIEVTIDKRCPKKKAAWKKMSKEIELMAEN